MIVGYNAQYGTKENDLYVNNSFVQKTSYESTSAWSEKNLGNISLNAGNNTIEIRKNWGWMHIDYIKVSTSLKSLNVWSASIANKSLDLQLYPNPVTEKNINVIFSGNIGDVELKLYDTSGRMLMHRTCIQNNQNIDLCDLQNGTYLLEISDKSSRKIKKFIVRYV